MQLFKKRDFFSTLSITGNAETGPLFTKTYADGENYKSYLTLIDFQNNRFYLQCPMIHMRFVNISAKFLEITQGVAHKHFFDRDARPSTNFSYSKK